MKQLNVYEIGIDPPPEEYLGIKYMSKSSSWGMFEGVSEVSGEVEYYYPDDCESLKEAYEKGYKLVFTDEEGFGEDGEAINITLQLNENTLLIGDNWVYDHEFYSSINTNITFPFQSEKAIGKSLSLGLVDLKEELVEDYTGTRASEPVKFKVKKMYIIYSSKSFRVTLFDYGQGFYFSHFDELDEFFNMEEK